jgi:hypothetical protein
MNLDMPPNTYKTPPGDDIGYGTFVERNVPTVVRFTDERVDIVRVPAFGPDWYYELSPGVLSNEGIIQAIKLYQFGFSKGQTLGDLQARASIREALGILEWKPTEG